MTTTLLTSQTSAREATADAIIIGVIPGTGGPAPAPGAEDVDAALDGSLAATLAALGATGKAEEITKIATAGRLAAPLIVAVGLGAPNGTAPLDGEALRRAAGAAVRALGPAHRQVALALPARDDAETEAVALGALLGGYEFTRYRAATTAGRELTVLANGTAGSAAVDRSRVLADAMSLVRDLVNTSASHLFPASFAAEAERVAAESGLAIEVLDEKALADGGYGGIDRGRPGFGAPAAAGPAGVRAGRRAARPWCSSGKGITFDSGGLSLKPAKAMEAMKSDMSGAAAVLGRDAARSPRSARPSTWSATCRSPRTCRAAPRSGRPT